MWKCIFFLFLVGVRSSYGQDVKILVAYHSLNGATLKLAEAITTGIRTISTAKVTLKRIPNIGEKFNNSLVSPDELANYDGIAFGSPVYFGGMSTEMKYFLDHTLDLWKKRKLEGIPATVFMTAGSGSGKEAAILSIWSTLASHGMVLLSAATAEIKEGTPGLSPFGITALTSLQKNRLPSKQELRVAQLQGRALAQAASRLKGLPSMPMPVGNYRPYVITGKYVYINQIALENGKVKFPGTIGTVVSLDQAKAATRLTALNVLAVLKHAVKGDFSKVKQAVQLTGYFKTTPEFQDHAMLMNEASDVMVQFLGDKGQHARAAIGVISLPLNSATEIQAIFELF
jgi:NAD(P)H dehydrogenase (quinone)